MADKLIRTIKAISVKKKAEGSIGFLTKEQDNYWYNIAADEKALDVLLESIIQKGNVVEFEVENGFPINFTLKEKATKQDGNFSDDLTTFEELLNDAHEKFGDITIKTHLVENDWEKQRAIFKALIQVAEGSMYEAYGDATQENCGEMVKKHWIRMAETRAIARALRWATNNAKTASEETEDGKLIEEQMQEAQEEEMSKP